MYLKIFNLLSFLITMGGNYFVIDGYNNHLPISNVSKTFNTSLTPPDWTFAIWGVIYIYIFLFCIGQFLPSFKLNNFVKNIGPWFIVSNVLNLLWIYIFTIGSPFAIAISFSIILLLLISLYICQIEGKFFSKESTLSEIILGNIPFSIYLGWLITATIVNFFTVLKAYNFKYIDDNLFYLFGIITATLIYLYNLYKNNNYVTMIVFAYVLIALYTKHENNKTLTIGNTTVIIVITISVLSKILIDAIFKNKNKNKSNEVKNNEVKNKLII